MSGVHPQHAHRPMPLAGVRHVVAVASGKGGVGKSTVAANLALALRRRGHTVGLLDADVYGPSIPMMLGVSGQPGVDRYQRLLPIQAKGISLMSIGFLSSDDAPVVWRGPMVARLIQQFLASVDWGELDVLLIDMPPGTGDAQLTLTQVAPLSGAIIVSTPQDVSLIDARKGLRMFRQVKVPIVGLVENMSLFTCPYCGETSSIFRQGGVDRVSKELDAPFLGALPLDPAVVLAGDEGEPIVVRNPESAAGRAFMDLAARVESRLEDLSGGAAALPPNFHMTWQASGLLPVDAASLPLPEVPRGQDERLDGPSLTGVEQTGAYEVTLSWSDGAVHPLPVRLLRLACPCAACIDEVSGARLLDGTQVPVDVYPKETIMVGRYALRFTWSDGHDTGLYSHDYLYRLGTWWNARTS